MRPCEGSTPVIAFGKGGALETVRGLGVVSDAPTGVFFDVQTSVAIQAAVRRFEDNIDEFIPSSIRRHAEQFSVAVFREKYVEFVDEAVQRWRGEKDVTA